jgi:hypothetical protein
MISMVAHDSGDHVRDSAIESLLEDLTSSFKVVLPGTCAKKKIGWSCRFANYLPSSPDPEATRRLPVKYICTHLVFILVQRQGVQLQIAYEHVAVYT